jgi:hypothetical protein
MAAGARSPDGGGSRQRRKKMLGKAACTGLMFRTTTPQPLALYIHGTTPWVNTTAPFLLAPSVFTGFFPCHGGPDVAVDDTKICGVVLSNYGAKGYGAKLRVHFYNSFLQGSICKILFEKGPKCKNFTRVALCHDPDVGRKKTKSVSPITKPAQAEVKTAAPIEASAATPGGSSKNYSETERETEEEEVLLPPPIPEIVSPLDFLL